MIFGSGVMSFMILLAAAAVTLQVVRVSALGDTFDAYTVSFIVLTVFALIFSVAVVIAFYDMAQKSQILIDALGKVANGDYLTQLNYRKHDTFAKVYDNFNKMTKELYSVQTLREDFTHNFSHEIKTPLFSIQGFANLLLEGGLSEEEQKRFLKIISDEAARLGRLADGILTLSKLESQQFAGEKKPIKFDSDINDCIVMLEWEWEKKNIDIGSSLEPVKGEGDGALLKQVWLNLLSNAIKFTPEGGKINVSLKREGDFAVVKVQDSGCGISEENLPHVFDKFFRASKEVDGNGLGLAICKRVCELEGGTISAESGGKAGEGTTFTVRLPLRRN